ncbi:MAG TPA: ABC transporter substrate-binding protein, partial [Dehalococcoidia bacterium]|nr:ABC transporter substrate-binding protein [Dehalococcoidia bacterium]
MRLLKKRLYLLAPLAIIVLAVFTLACESATQQAQGDGQILRMRLDGEPETIDPSTAQFGPSLGVARNLFATALRLDPVNGEVEPYVAREVPSKENKGISQDGLTYTFKLNSEAVWEDGRPLTSQDFVYSLRRLLDPRVASYYGQSYFAGVIAGSGELAAATGADPATIERLKGQLG